MELNYSELAKRDVINVADGSCLGRIIDLTLTFPDGVLAGIFVPGRKQHGLLKMFDKTRIYIEENKIIKIGGDVILVDLRCADLCAPNVGVGKTQPKPSPKPCPPQKPCPPKPCPPPQNICCEGLDLSNICDENGRIDFSDY